MNDASAIDGATVDAYRQTEYRVTHEPPFVLRIDQASTELAALFHKHRVCCAAYLSAANPLSRKTDDNTNLHNNARLAADLRGYGLIIIDGVGRHPTGAWPAEPSFLALGLDLEAAKSLGRKFNQNAIVWCGADSCARLVLLR